MTSTILENLEDLISKSVDVSNALLADIVAHVRNKVVVSDRVSSELLNNYQFEAHGVAWIATYIESLRQMSVWSKVAKAENKFDTVEKLILQIGFGEYLSQLKNGIPMSQTEFIRLHDIGLSNEIINKFLIPEVEILIKFGNTQLAREQLCLLMQDRLGMSTFGFSGLDDDLEMVREQFRRFSDEKVAPYAHQWHLKDELIPKEIIDEMAELGVFGLTIPEKYGGFGLSKAAMCVVSEELSRGYIGVGSLGTRSEIAAELILCGGTEEQKKNWLPRISDASALPTAVFTEPNTGSDLGSLATRAIRTDDYFEVTGNKTWITHASRTNVMTLLARTDLDTKDYRGLSMFLAEKEAGTTENPFPSEGMTGGEIEVLGYRGMKEYEIAFDKFKISKGNLLGGIEGQGFKQLMQTFESARIQTAARAVGVAQSALDISLNYAIDRKQFGKSLIAFPRVSSKLAMMAVEIMIARQLTYYSAREKDASRRCDLEAGMAKLLAARVAWSSADNGLQIHGGNGFALEYPISRILCDARILNIFEGAAEIQAQVIVRRILDTKTN
ncbi:MAG: acyl-CoA/acyl-ACP dehydrogenase [Paracoccaceae bacterium]|jgi:(2S)-methylsuccinyl-CoA dehydrogenase|nr:acyl-CoA/acyl-ACP dehydrogenase [Paracoccaceae bacterium]